MTYILPSLLSTSSLHDFIAAGEDYDDGVLSSPSVVFQSGSVGRMPRSINILDDLVFEPTKYFNLSLSTNSPDCIIPNPLVRVTILDDGEDELQQLLNITACVKVTASVTVECVIQLLSLLNGYSRHRIA